MSKKNDPVDGGASAIENEGAQVEGANNGSPAVEKEKPYQIITANSREELEKAINDLKAQQPEGVSLAASPIARDAFGVYTQRIDFIKK